MQKHEGHPLENLQSCENRVCNPQRGICTKEDNVISKCIFVKLQLKMQLLRVTFQKCSFKGQLCYSYVEHGRIHFYINIFYWTFSTQLLNYNIENWVWTRTLDAPCCMLSGLSSSMENIDPSMTFHSRNAIVRL